MPEIVFLQDWKRMDRLIRLYSRSQGMYGRGTWSALFKTKKYERHLVFREKLKAHIDWLMKRKFGHCDYRYLNRVHGIVIWREQG